MRWLLLAISCSILCSVWSTPANKDEPYLKINTLWTIFNVGDQKALYCEGMHLSGELEWYDNSGQKILQKSAKNKRMYVEHRPPPAKGPIYLPLMVQYVVIGDSGVYTCKAGDLTATINITVGEKVVINELEQSYEAEEGHGVELSCQAKGTPNPVIQWYRDDESQERIVNNHKYKISFRPKSSTSVLKISNLNHMDPGTYRCRATQESISHFAEKICHLKVQHKPVILTSFTEREVYAILDERKNITCTAIAYPPPTFTWSKHIGNYDEELNIEDGEYQITTSSTPGAKGISSVLTLHITNATLDSEYKCTVENTKGRPNFIFHVSLGNKPDPPTAVTMIAASGSNITFEVSCENCTFFIDDGLSPRPDNLPVLAYVFEVVPHMEGFAVPYWVNSTLYAFDLSEHNGTQFVVDNLDKSTEYHVRVATRNLAGLSDWLDFQGAKTTDGAVTLAKSFGLLTFALIASIIY